MPDEFEKLFSYVDESESKEKNEEEETESERIEKVFEEETSGNFSKKVIIVMLLLLVIFVAIVLRHFIGTGLEPTTLIIAVFSLFTGQFGLMAWLMKHKRDSLYREITTYKEAHNMPFPLEAQQVESMTEMDMEDPVDEHTIAHHSIGDDQEDTL